MKEKLNRKITKEEIIKTIPLVLILLILVGVGSYAFAITDLLGIQNLGIVNNQELSLTFVEGENDFKVTPNPMSDADGKAQTEYYEFQVSSTSNVVYDLEYFIYLVENEKGNTVENKYVKVYLTKVDNGSETVVLDATSIDELTRYGFDGEVGRLLGENTFNYTSNTKTTKTDTYRLRTWLSEDTVINEETTPNIEETENGLNISGVSGGYQFKLGVSTYKILDISGANAPELLSNMLPVYYDATCNNNAGCWEKADYTNTEEAYQWYNYDEKMWANAVTVSSTNRQTYIDAQPGTEIAMTDINSMWVWIPRYTYTYFNSSTPVEIQIKFEEGTGSGGTITCTDNVSGTAGTSSQTCTDKNTTSLVAGTSTYTHPAFNFGGTPLEGFWFGKFENSINGTNLTSERTAEHEITIKPNFASLKYKAVSYLFTDVRQMEKANNVYGFEQSASTTFNLDGTLTGDTNNIDTHMLKNIEWGAVAYLSHSKYGINKEIAINSYRTGTNSSTYVYMTGCGPQSADSTDAGTTCNPYTSTLGQSASTTGNVYGVYDMSGGVYEYVMGNMVDSSGNFYPSSAGQWGTTIPLAKYYDSYTYNTSNTTYTRGRLGDATVETGPTSKKTWYSDYANFPYSSISWFRRGGSAGGGGSAGAFYFYNCSGNADSYNGSRASLCVLD